MIRWADLYIERLDENMIEFISRNRIRVVGLKDEIFDTYNNLLRKRDLITIKRLYIEDADQISHKIKDLIVFRPLDKNSMRRGGKIRLTFTILIDEENYEYCSDEQIEAMRGGSASLEILARPLLDEELFPRYIRYIKYCVRKALINGVDVILSSGARRFEELFSPGSMRFLERYITGVRGSLTYSWYTLLERWNKKFVEEMIIEKREKT